MQWYIVTTYSGRDDKVVDSLKETIIDGNFERLFGKILVPVECVPGHYHGKGYEYGRKFLPNHVFIEMTMNAISYTLVKNDPNVIDFIGSDNLPTPVAEKEMEIILKRSKN